MNKALRAGTLAVLAVAVAGVAWWWSREQRAPVPPEAAAVAARMGDDTGGVPVLPAQRVVPVVLERAVAFPAALASAASKPSSAQPSTMNLQLCGVGPVTIRLPPKGAGAESFDPLPGPLGHLARAEAWHQVLAAMESNPSERSRAAALVLRASGLPEADAAMRPVQAPPDTVPVVRQLAELARSTRDAGVLQWALAVCKRYEGVAECQRLSAQQLVVLAPDDGRHWLLLAAVDPLRRKEALLRAAHASTIGVSPPLWPLVDAAAPATLPPYLLQDVLIEAVGVDAAMPDASLHAVATHCTGQGDEQRTTCLALADALYLRGQDLLTQSVGRGVGKRHGWPTERVAAAQAEQLRLMTKTHWGDADQPYACEAVQRTTQFLRDRAQFGEIVTLRRMADAASAPAGAPR